MSTEIPDPAHRAPTADQPGRFDPAYSDPATSDSATSDPATSGSGYNGSGFGDLAGPGTGNVADGGLAGRTDEPDGIWQQPTTADPVATADPAAPAGLAVPAAPALAGPPKGLTRTVAREITSLLSVAVVSVLLSLAVGALWVWLAPSALGTLSQGGVYYTSPESKEFIGQDGTLGIICAATGLLLGIGAYFLSNRRGSVGAVIGLAGGGLLGGYLATIAAGKFGPGHGETIQKMIVGMHDNTTFALPLQLRAVAVIWFWPLAAILAYLLMVTFFGPLDPSPAKQPPQWEPQAWSQQPEQPEQQQGWTQPGGQAWPGHPDQGQGQGPESGPQPGQVRGPAPSGPYAEPAQAPPPFHNGTGPGPDSALGPDEVDRRQ